jgi:hypothetical protein
MGLRQEDHELKARVGSKNIQKLVTGMFCFVFLSYMAMLFYMLSGKTSKNGKTLLNTTFSPTDTIYIKHSWSLHQ